ncbi:winged helix-turn-helix domain-containing protein [Marinactinospora thermotolerans]|uniref:Response regulators consisting of a CheY-like receiver domain and a winged-helix DNA-binding domain n=1 Tax=Marinactinospora thermotolerans DSM 45154 TaxID=1122192 RepID=A0A1T4K6L9_9ACTN|nr:winged helix-turn-helix domain-containing protein [Marinactinospora thermotolerans]SJZ38074.1 Response regulators consisting of a CheY-like receiver domain and a winged-helix DNA-binding domain [Marinactinospora thermotolerans DSM 45154]
MTPTTPTTRDTVPSHGSREQLPLPAPAEHHTAVIAERLLGTLPATGLLVDRVSRRAVLDGAQVELSYREFELLAHLVEEPWRVFTRSELLEQVWPTRSSRPTRTVDVHVHRLRRKLGRFGERIVTVRRVGYAYRP